MTVREVMPRLEVQALSGAVEDYDGLLELIGGDLPDGAVRRPGAEP